MKFVKLSILLAAVISVAAGCSGKAEPAYGDKKEDWAPSKPPAGWRGPGQPGGATPPPNLSGPPAGTTAGK